MIDTPEKVSKEDSIVNSASDEVKKKRTLFPRLPLKKAIDLAKAIYDIGQGEPVRRLKVFDHLEKAPNSGPSRTLVIVSSVYGLTVGGYQADYLSLTETGKRLVNIDSQIKKYETIYNILFGNEIFSSFIEYWKNKTVPADDIAEDWLLRNHKLSSQDAKVYWEIIKANILDFNLTEQLSGKQMIISKETALDVQKGNGANRSQIDVSEVTPSVSSNPTLNSVTHNSRFEKKVFERGDGWSFDLTIKYSKNPLPQEIRTNINTIITSLESSQSSGPLKSQEDDVSQQAIDNDQPVG